MIDEKNIGSSLEDFLQEEGRMRVRLELVDGLR